MLKRIAAMAIGAAGTLAVALAVAPGAGATAQTGSAAGMTFDLGPSPFGIPANCPFPNADANFLFLDGTAVGHESTNKNGDWGGMTIEGQANFYEDSTLIATGHLTVWGGGGNNAKQQTEGGLTLNFVSSSVTIHVNFHQTTNANGTVTATPGAVVTVCS